MTDAREDEDGPGSKRAKRVEWVLGLLSAALVLGMAAVIAAHAWREPRAYPDLRIARTLDEPAAPDQLRFVVENLSGQTAAQVTVSMHSGESERRVTIDFVPAHSSVRGAFLLGAEGEAEGARLVVESYLDP